MRTPTCLARDCDVVVTGTSTGRIPWPRCRAVGTHGGGSGILVDEELARAVRWPELTTTALRGTFSLSGCNCRAR